MLWRIYQMQMVSLQIKEIEMMTHALHLTRFKLMRK